MDLKSWYRKRGMRFIWQRGRNLLSRYGMTSSKAISRIESTVKALAGVGCWITFPVPGIIVKRHPDYIRRIQEYGSEIAVHGYNHIDLKSLPPEQACDQLLRAVKLFKEQHLSISGFRCPFLSCSDDLINIIPPGIFKYSSNKAISWDTTIPEHNSTMLQVSVINQFYEPQNARLAVSVPWVVNRIVEIPVCVPDDLQLIDGYHMTSKKVTDNWIYILKEIHHRGELFNLMFHPELGTFTTDLFLEIIAFAKQLKPAVWICRLAEIADWWIEKSSFSYDLDEEDGLFKVKIHCTSRATILCRGFQPFELGQIGSYETWDERHISINSRCFTIATKTKPLIGIANNIPIETRNFLIEQGYLIDLSDQAPQCSIFLDASLLKNISTPLDLVNYIENSNGPLIRIWRWPDGNKSAMSITGDMDALSLMDYASRLFY